MIVARRRGPWVAVLGPADIPALLQYVGGHWLFFGGVEWAVVEI